MSEAVDDDLRHEAEADAVPLLRAARGVPPVIDNSADLDAAITDIAAGTGPVAVDAERASGYRYGQRAYLVQIRREGVGTILIDPVPFGDLRANGAAVSDAQWVVHAASQDLPSLREVGLEPEALFDTELAARLAGYERVGLATMVELLLGLQLAKEHSAVDWSRRPLPEPWLRYAALDVEILLELRDALEAELRRQGKLDWAHQEFDAVLRAPHRRREPIHGDVPAASTGRATGVSWQSSGRYGRRAIVSRATETARPVASCQTRRSSRRRSAAPGIGRELGKLAGWGGRSTRRLVARCGRHRRGVGRCRRRAATARSAGRRAPAGQSMARPRSGRGVTAGPRACGADRDSPSSTGYRWRTC